MPLRVRVRRGALREAPGRAGSAVQEPAQASTVRELSWIDGFYREMKPFLFVRDEDGVVILPPNQVYKANESGIGILRHMERTGSIARLPGLRDGERAAQVNAFFSDLRDFCRGDTRGMDRRSGVEMVPYSFSYTSLPILAEIAVTYRCTNACLFCYASCGSGGPGCAAPQGCSTMSDAGGTGVMGGSAAGGTAASREMSLREVMRIIDIFKTEARIPFFSFTGGEPLLRPDLEKMIRHACRRGLRVNLISNGVLADSPRAKSLYAAGLRTAQVSVESPDEETHDRLTGMPGSWRRTVAGIAALKEAGISVQTNTTITAANSTSAPFMPAFLKSLGIGRFAMNLFIPAEGRPKDLFFSYSKIGGVVEAVRAEAMREGLTFYWYSPTPHCLYNPIARGLGNKSCAAMDGLLSVSPSGDVLPCSSYPKPMGNLLEKSFRSIWYSSGARHFKDKQYAPPECAGCGSFTACQAACPLYWQYAGTSEIKGPRHGYVVGAGGKPRGMVKEA